MLIPQFVKVGNMFYDVEETDEWLFVDNNVCWGTCDYNNQKISLYKKANQQSKEATFLHELIHAICHDRDIELGENTELIVDAIAKGLHGVMIDNNNIFNDEDMEIVEAE